jgi:hypothetical protein
MRHLPSTPALVTPLVTAFVLAWVGPSFAAPGGKPAAAVCQAVGGREAPAADRPTPTQLRILKGCDSEALYYGEKGPPDFTRARLCAFQDDDTSAAGVFSGPTILMQLYANGLGGVKRDLDLATAYACDIDGAPAEIEYRVQHLQALKTKSEPRRFDYCDDITSGLAGGFCSARDATIADKARSAQMAGLDARIPAAAKPAWAALRRASAGFVDAHGGEVDESGTARAQLVIDEQEATRNAFTAQVVGLLDGRWPGPTTAADFDAADQALNAAYKKALAHLASKDNYTTVKPDDSRRAQRAWIVFRDAFEAFAPLAMPETSAKAVAARLTQERTKALVALAE